MTCTKTNGIFECDNLTDVWDMVLNPQEGRHYTRLNTPTIQDLEHIEIGNVVALSRGINKFFVVIIENTPCNFGLCGRVTIGDLNDQSLQVGDILCFLYRNVYSISEE